MGDVKDSSDSKGPLPKRIKVDGDVEGKDDSGNSRQVSLDPR